MPELSTKPYLLRAIYDWCTDSGFTPYVAVAVDASVRVPAAHVKNGEIVLNVSALATNRLKIGNEAIEFQARFGGVAHEIYVPIERVIAVYARENGQGMAFEVPRMPPTDAPADADAAPADESAPEGRTALVPVSPAPASEGDTPPRDQGGRPRLKLVK